MPIDLEIQLHSIDELLCRIEKLEKKQESKNENKSKIQKVKKRTRDLLEVSTSHGIPNIVRTKSLFILIMWSFFIITSTCLCSFFVIKAILDYLKYHTITNIQVINENQAQFPTISFCDTRDQNFNIKIIYFWFQNEDLLKEWQNHFESYVDKRYGRCYRFNSGKNMLYQSIPIKNSTKSGYYDGLIFEIKSNSKIDYSQIIVFVHNYTQTLPTIHNKGIWITPGS